MQEDSMYGYAKNDEIGKMICLAMVSHPFSNKRIRMLGLEVSN